MQQVYKCGSLILLRFRSSNPLLKFQQYIKALQVENSTIARLLFLAGAEGLEPSARGFGDHCSTN